MLLHLRHLTIRSEQIHACQGAETNQTIDSKTTNQDSAWVDRMQEKRLRRIFYGTTGTTPKASLPYKFIVVWQFIGRVVVDPLYCLGGLGEPSG
jgi:hypothetical protein